MKTQIHTENKKSQLGVSFLTPKLIGFLLIMLLMVGKSWGQYAGTGTFTKITSIADLTDGYYVIVNSGDGFAMNNTHNGTFLDKTNVTPSSGTLLNPAAAIVWKIESNGTGRTIYNEATSKYVSYTGSDNNVQVVDAVTTDNQRWTFTYGSEVFTVKNMALTIRLLQYNANSPRFACYKNILQYLLLYKMEASATPTIALSNNGTQITAGDVVVGTTNHILSSFKLAVTTADATLTSTSTGSGDILGFISLNKTITSGSTAYFWVTSDIASGATVGKTISVDAIANADLTFASGNKSGSSTAGGVQTIIASTAPIISVGLLTAFGNQCIGSTYGPNSFSISGSNLTTANVTVSALSGFTFSTTSSGTYTNSLSLTQSGGTFSQTVYVKFSPSSVQSYNGNITVGGGGAGNQDVAANGAGIKIAPTTPASNITFASIGTTSMTVNWTNGNGEKRILIMNTTNSFTNPTDGTDPIANAAYSGSGEQVVYNGTANTVDISSLSQNTEYWFRVYKYNNTGANTKHITSTATDNPKSESTIDGPCVFEDFTNSNATTSYADNNFVGNNGITWTYVASRDQNEDANNSGIDGKALMLRRVADNSKVTSSTFYWWYW